MAVGAFTGALSAGGAGGVERETGRSTRGSGTVSPVRWYTGSEAGGLDESSSATLRGVRTGNCCEGSGSGWPRCCDSLPMVGMERSRCNKGRQLAASVGDMKQT